MPTVVDTVVHTSYGQLDLAWGPDGHFDGNFGRSFAGQVNGLVGAARPGGVYVSLSREPGGSQVRIDVLDGELGSDPTWEDVVEVSVELPVNARVTCWAWDTPFSSFDVDGGPYRLRVSARGRDAGADAFGEDGVDHYLLELWPAPLAPDLIVRTGSADATSWHRRLGRPT